MPSRQHRQTDEEPRRRSRTAWIVTVLVVVFVLYPLSIGPAYGLLWSDDNPGRLAIPLHLAYFPVFKIFEVTGNEDVLSAYVMWWVKLI